MQPPPRSMMVRKVGLAELLPFRADPAGDPAQMSYSRYTESLRVARLEEFATTMAQRLTALEEATDAQRGFDPLDFGRRLLAVEQEVLGGADSVKSDYLQQYLVACLAKAPVDATWKDLFLRYLRLCTGCHLTVLRYFFEAQGSLAPTDRFELPQPTEEVPLTCRHLLRRLPPFDATLLSAVLADLESFGLIRLWGNRRTVELGWSITDNGIQFIAFVTDEVSTSGVRE